MLFKNISGTYLTLSSWRQLGCRYEICIASYINAHNGTLEVTIEICTGNNVVEAVPSQDLARIISS